MHIEHTIPLSRGGRSDESNLCLACAWCNSYKWVQTHDFDPEIRTEVVYIIGLTVISRAAVETLKMNKVSLEGESYPESLPCRARDAEALWLFPDISEALLLLLPICFRVLGKRDTLATSPLL